LSIAFRFLAAGVLLAGSGCVSWRPADISNSDPNLAAQQRTERHVESDNVSVFISDHPELDAETKKELREGRITLHEARARLKRQTR
jgi:hypothetical protein